jgi:hypothetical protein
MKKITMSAALSIAAIGLASPALAQETPASTTTPPAEATAPATPASPAAPTESAAPTAGAKVFDSAGVEIGTIESVSGSSAVIAAGTARATVPVSALGAAPNGVRIGITKEQFEAAVAQASAGAAQPGATPPTGDQPAAQPATPGS